MWGNVFLISLLFRPELTHSPLEPLMSKQCVIKWEPGREWASDIRTGCSPYETRFCLHETWSYESLSPCLSFLWGFKNFLLYVCNVSEKPLTCNRSWNNPSGQELHWCKQTRFHWKAVISERCSCACASRTEVDWTGPLANSVRSATILRYWAY
jgi:hypothetical protein